MPEILDGRKISQDIKSEVASAVETLRLKIGIRPRLHVLLVGNNPASEVYVKSKTKTANDLGISSQTARLPETSSQEQVVAIINRWNDDGEVHGILVQLPLPAHLHTDTILERILPTKDVDGLHPLNLGLLAAGRPRFIPCTPYGVWELLKRTGHSPTGKQVVILGRSNLVGKPLALLLSLKAPDCDATVTLCHSQTPDLRGMAGRADILISAIGKPEFVTSDMVKPGAVVIDVGIHRRNDGNLVGDVAFESVAPIASAITPVPGGVGPMTIAMLMQNTVQAATST